jgi:hypothetical protein
MFIQNRRNLETLSNIPHGKSKQSQSKRPSCYFSFKQLQKDQNGNGSFGCHDRPVPRSSTDVEHVNDCKAPKPSEAKTTVLDEHQKTSGSEVVKDTQSIDFVHLVQSPSPSRL